jgi:hypothetical protein
MCVATRFGLHDPKHVIFCVLMLATIRHPFASRLRQAIQPIKDTPMDDTAGEGPHAIAHRQMLHSRRARWPWVASSCRMRQNMVVVDTLIPAVDANLQTDWDRYKSVLHLSEADAVRNKKIARSKFEMNVYRMSHLTSAPDADVVAESVEDHPPGPDGLGVAGDVLPQSEESEVDQNDDAAIVVAPPVADGALAIALQRGSDHMRFSKGGFME